MTWAEFKAAVEAQGVQDSDAIDYIDVHRPDVLDVARDAAAGDFAVTSRP